MDWDKIKEKMRERLPQGTMSLWIDPLECLRQDRELIELAAPDRFFCSWIEENMLPLFKSCLAELGSPAAKIMISVGGAEESCDLPASSQPEPQLRLPCLPANIKATIRALHPRYTFSEFMVGESNLMAKSACEAMANNDASLGRSLFIESGTGLGKSHLTHAVAHKIIGESPATRLHYLTAHQLTAEMVRAIQGRSMEQFKDKYQNHCDVLLIEDVHTMGGRSKTQMELNAALDMLIKRDKRVIFTSKMPPHEIPDIVPEFRSRLSAGLITTINPPDLNTRVHIIRKKAENNALVLDDELVGYLAEHIKGDIRRVESAIVGLKARVALRGGEPNLEMIKEIIGNIVGHTCQNINTELIRDFIAREFRVPVKDLRSRSRKKEVAFPRQITMYLARKLTRQPLADIGRALNRDHSTVVHSIRVISEAINRDGSVRGQMELLSNKLRKEFH